MQDVKINVTSVKMAQRGTDIMYVDSVCVYQIAVRSQYGMARANPYLQIQTSINNTFVERVCVYNHPANTHAAEHLNRNLAKA